MPEILQERDRKARRQHTCSYCGEPIAQGEVYEWAKLINDGYIYEWKNHKRCGRIAAELWEYADPDDGMTEDDFSEACTEFCQRFICPDCPRRDKEYDEAECMDDKTYCTDRIYDFLQTHEFYNAGTNRWGYGIWKCRERKERTEDGHDTGITL